MASLKKQLFEKGEPVREKVLDYCYDQPVPSSFLVKLPSKTNAESGFDSMDKLKLAILAMEELEDMLMLDKVTGAIQPNMYNPSLAHYTSSLLDTLSDLYRVVVRAKKYKKFNHAIKVIYESKLKEKDNA